MRRGDGARRPFAAGTWACVAVILATIGAEGYGDPGQPRRVAARMLAEGRALFEKRWEPGKPSRHGGDGLGPLYNETSCVACHRLGGPGGGGPKENDVILLNAVLVSRGESRGSANFRGFLRDLHPGFLRQASVVFHRAGIGSDYLEWRARAETTNSVQTPYETIAITRSRRNTPALFGAGMIDRVPDRALLAAAERKHSNFPEIKGRVSRLEGETLGRFGWKAQVANLHEFVLAACANELGLEVPAHHQASLKPASDDDRPALDLDVAECDALVAYLGSLPAPVGWTGGGERVLYGRGIFESVGCAECHAPTMGPAEGIYSDLLLHDLGPEDSDAGTYYGAPTSSPGQLASDGPATAREWRTAPLWGIRASAPYMHDGRASTIDEAIRAHGGEASQTAGRYARLPRWDKRALLAFLDSLAPPSSRRR
jgi:CxxC motif-containing protein (DUF1111 family)